MSKLTKKQVKEIATADELYRILADHYGVCISTISVIKSRKSWKHLNI